MAGRPDPVGALGEAVQEERAGHREAQPGPQAAHPGQQTVARANPALHLPQPRVGRRVLALLALDRFQGVPDLPLEFVGLGLVSHGVLHSPVWMACSA